ncbi:MAG TPA: addiction module protein [Thermoanaerobaculia bacterium]|jgi:putative addiction module component (TIGR02574 family)|nr:addiction module protein [Thermoanaerobaculia bacterium]
MNVIAEKLLRQALTLNDEGRAAIAGALIDSVHGEADPGAEAAWDREIDRRVRQIDDGSVAMTPWSEVRKRLFHGFE